MKGSNKQNKLIEKFIQEMQEANLTIHEVEKIPSLLKRKLGKKIQKQKRRELFGFVPESSDGPTRPDKKCSNKKSTK